MITYSNEVAQHYIIDNNTVLPVIHINNIETLKKIVIYISVLIIIDSLGFIFNLLYLFYSLQKYM